VRGVVGAFLREIFYHKRYSFISVEDEKGERVLEREVRHENPFLFREVLGQVPGPVSVVFEASLNWAWLHEELARKS